MNSWFTQENIFNLASNLAITVAALVLFLQKVKAYMKEFATIRQTDVAGKVKQQAQIDANILKRMNEVRDLVDGDRLLVFEFHNQEHYANGREALRMTCTYESCKINLTSIRSKLIGLGLSLFPQFLSSLFDRDVLYWDRIDGIEKKMPNFYTFLSQFEAQACYCHILKNGNREPIGFVMVVYHKPTNVQLEVDAEEVSRLSFFIEEQIQYMTDRSKVKTKK